MRTDEYSNSGIMLKCGVGYHDKMNHMFILEEDF